jgi:undecaprenyl pyrophosphate phosphatase UppP
MDVIKVEVEPNSRGSDARTPGRPPRGMCSAVRNHRQDAARFTFLLSTPIIGAAAALKLPELIGGQGDGVRGPALVGALGAAVTAYLAVRFLVRLFETNRLTPFTA